MSSSKKIGGGTKKSTGLRWRGIVEGFYYEMWSHAGRLRTLGFMRGAGFDSYIYAPKADPHHRDRWREPYPAADRRRFRELVRAADGSGVEFFWAISPGLTIRYSGRKDFNILLGRMLEMAGLGVKSFGLFLDDIPEKLSKTDKTFGSLAHAQVDVTNRIYKELKNRTEVKSFLFCPTEYWGLKATPHLKTLGRGLEREIGVFWTGEHVVSPVVTGEHARRIGAALRRRPVLWDNYPVNDYNRRKLNMGPLMGRDAELPRRLEGYFANPMNEEMCSRLPLLTIGDYLRDPEGYDPAASWERAVRRAGGRRGAALGRVADVLRPGIFPDEPLPAVVSAIKDFERSEKTAAARRNGNKLLRELSALREAAGKLPGALDGVTAREMRPHLKQIRLAAAAAECAVKARLTAQLAARLAGSGERERFLRNGEKLLRKAKKVGMVVYAGAIEAFAERTFASNR